MIVKKRKRNLKQSKKPKGRVRTSLNTLGKDGKLNDEKDKNVHLSVIKKRGIQKSPKIYCIYI